jgi:glycerol-3-phosphate dehydrogenase
VLIDRAAAWNALASLGHVNLLVIGGGVTGGAVAFEAARRGLSIALVERNDYGSGTSSRSSKLIHGGLRYLKEGHVGLTRESVRERQALLREAPGLVDPLTFLMPHYRARKPTRAAVSLGLALYDALAGTWQHRYVGPEETATLVPALDRRDLLGAHCYVDATTDDARLVLRLIAQAQEAGAMTINYAEARASLDGGRICGAEIVDACGGESIEVRADAVIAATGVFADELRSTPEAPARLRPLRGSHLVIADWRLPLSCAVAFEHPEDRRLVFAYPWEGATLVGTTDLDHHDALQREPSIAAEETRYLLAALQYQFPACELGGDDIVATFAGVRPIVGAPRPGAPSTMRRDHVVWNERGLITVTGGKLTTFRPMALAALSAAAPALPPFDRSWRPVFARDRVTLSLAASRPSVGYGGTSSSCASSKGASYNMHRLLGRYGTHACEIIASASSEELECVGSTPFLWAELRWTARHEMVVHLDDLLLRRTRIGLLLRDGGMRYADRIGAMCRTQLGWDDARWNAERARYERIRREHYA